MRILLALFALPAAAQQDCWKHKEFGRTQQAVECFSKFMASPDPAMRAEALWGLEKYQEAVNQFQAATKARPKDPKPRVRLGELFLERYQPGDAVELFNEALEIDEKNARALLGVARAMGERWDRRATEMAQKALDADPKLSEARELLARLAAEDNDFPKAMEHADAALAATPGAMEALGVRAAIEFLEDRETQPWFDRAKKANPASGQAYNVAGELLVLNRRYHEGITFFRKAIEAQPNLWEARARLGVNLMRLGEEQEARREVEACFGAGYAPAMVKNTLTLMDSYKNFRTFKSQRAILRLHKKEADLLQPYFESEIQRVMSAYDKKYGH